MSDVTSKVFQPTPELTDLLVKSGSPQRETSLAASAEVCKSA